jgi:hypothetical protein
VSFELDWNNQQNGSYLSAGVILAPDVTSGDPGALSDWLKIEYVGVPPGHHARMVVGVSRNGNELTLYNDGWPDRNRAGRPITRQRVTIELDRGGLRVLENGEALYSSVEPVAAFQEPAHLYLQIASHSNYPRRSILFGEIGVSVE